MCEPGASGASATSADSSTRTSAAAGSGGEAFCSGDIVDGWIRFVDQVGVGHTEVYKHADKGVMLLCECSMRRGRRIAAFMLYRLPGRKSQGRSRFLAYGVVRKVGGALCPDAKA